MKYVNCEYEELLAIIYSQHVNWLALKCSKKKLNNFFATRHYSSLNIQVYLYNKPTIGALNTFTTSGKSDQQYICHY